MAIGIRIKLPGITQEQFDTAHDHINPTRTPPKGLIFHASGPIDGGWGIIDFWESRETSMPSRSIPEGMAAAGVTPQGPPDIKEFPSTRPSRPRRGPRQSQGLPNHWARGKV